MTPHLDPGQRADLIRTILNTLCDLDPVDVGINLRAFELDPVLYEQHDSLQDYRHRLAESLSYAHDPQLTGLASHLGFGHGASQDSGSAPRGPWATDGLHLFISHLAAHQGTVQQVADRLVARFGIECFVAHSSIGVTLEWQSEIESALSTADALVGFTHSGFTASFWCQQEVGWAHGRGIPAFFLRFGEDPRGFDARFQWPSCAPTEEPEAIAELVLDLAEKQGVLLPKICDTLVSALVRARSFDHSGDIATRLNLLEPSLNDEQWNSLEEAISYNDQVYGSRRVDQPLTAIFDRGGRTAPWPNNAPRPR